MFALLLHMPQLSHEKQCTVQRVELHGCVMTVPVHAAGALQLGA